MIINRRWPRSVPVLTDDLLIRGGYSHEQYTSKWKDPECPRCVTEWADWLFNKNPYGTHAPRSSTSSCTRRSRSVTRASRIT